VVGLLLAIVCGVGGAVLLGLSPTLERTLFPYAIVVQTTPTVTIAPIAIIWIGAGNWSIIAVSVILCFFPMLSNTLVGLNSSDPETRSLLKLYGASRLETMRKLRLPGSMPYIMAGVRISAGLSVIGAMVGEFVVGAGGSEGGLGALVQKSAEQLKTPLLVSGALAGGCLGIVYYVAAKQLSNYLLGWHESMADGAGQGGRVRLD
jgi:NitT/TauT family transport system permease protein